MEGTPPVSRIAMEHFPQDEAQLATQLLYKLALTGQGDQLKNLVITCQDAVNTGDKTLRAALDELNKQIAELPGLEGKYSLREVQRISRELLHRIIAIDWW